MINGINTIGFVGGGQLGKMMILKAKELGFRIAVLDTASDCPCSSIADKLIVAKNFNDKKAYQELAKQSDIITYEFEHIDADTLGELENAGHTIYPSVNSLKTIKDKLTQKQALAKSGIAVPEFETVNTTDDIYAYYNTHKKPFFLKARTGGYDGKGNYFVKSLDDIEKALKFLNVPVNLLMTEKAVDFQIEVSVIATRGIDGQCVVYPVSENEHKNSILDVTKVPAVINSDTQKKVMEVAKQVMECFKGVGTFCVELFVNEKLGEVLVNEVAPRVHNSGHYSIEACYTSQFESHIRAIVGLGLGNPDLKVKAAVMKNVIGDCDGKAKFYGVEDAYKIKNVNMHIYCKPHVKAGRKMGHYTIVGDSLNECLEKLGRIDIKVRS